jgi:hypothetical protein
MHSGPRRGAELGVERDPGTFTLSIADGFALGESTNEATFGSALSDARTG